MGRASGHLPSIAEEAEDDDATVGPTLPKAKKRKVKVLTQQQATSLSAKRAQSRFT